MSFESTSALVIGGAGFVGSLLVQGLLDAGTRVGVLLTGGPRRPADGRRECGG